MLLVDGARCAVGASLRELSSEVGALLFFDGVHGLLLTPQRPTAANRAGLGGAQILSAGLRFAPGTGAKVPLPVSIHVVIPLLLS